MHALYGLIILALGFGVVLLVGWTIHALCAFAGRGVVRALAELTAWLLLATLAVYGMGVFSKFPRDWSDPCPVRGDVAVVRVEDGALPLRSVCVWEDGRSVDQVPGYVNPLVFTLLGFAGASALLLGGAVVREGAGGGGAVDRSRDRKRDRKIVLRGGERA